MQQSKRTPAVSVVLPVYNGAETIEFAIRSILHQTLTDLELIVVDDGSRDATLAKVAAIHDDRMVVLRHDHRGVVAAANSGTMRARAPIIARMDADDVSHPERIARQLDWLHRHQVDAVGCRIRIVDRAGTPVPSLSRYERWINEEAHNDEQIRALRFVELPLVNPTILARRAYFDLTYRDNGLPEDYELLLRAAAQGMSFSKVPETLFDWIDHSDRATRIHPRYSQDAFLNCRRIYLRKGPLRDIKQVDLWGVGQTGKTWLRWLQSIGLHVRRAYDVNERLIGREIHATKVYGPDSLIRADGTPILIAVGADKARGLIQSHIVKYDYRAGVDAWYVA